MYFRCTCQSGRQRTDDNLPRMDPTMTAVATSHKTKNVARTSNSVLLGSSAQHFELWHILHPAAAAAADDNTDTTTTTTTTDHDNTDTDFHFSHFFKTRCTISPSDEPDFRAISIAPSARGGVSRIGTCRQFGQLRSPRFCKRYNAVFFIVLRQELR